MADVGFLEGLGANWRLGRDDDEAVNHSNLLHGYDALADTLTGLGYSRDRYDPQRFKRSYWENNDGGRARLDTIWSDVTAARAAHKGSFADVPQDRAEFETWATRRMGGRDADQATAARGGWGGYIAGSLGSGLVTAAQPEQLPFMVAGGAAPTIAKAFGRGLLINGTITAMEAPVTSDIRASMGEEYTPEEAGAQALIGGVLDVGLHVGGKAAARGSAAIDAAIDGRMPGYRAAKALNRETLAGLSDADVATRFGQTVPAEMRTADETAALHVFDRDEWGRGTTPFRPTPEGADAHARNLSAAIAAVQARVDTTPVAAASVSFAPIVPRGAVGGTLDPAIVGYFTGRGLSVEQARGIAAGIHAESRSDIRARGPRYGAMGLGQWLGPRRDAIIARYGERPSLRQQLDFMWDELNGGDAGGKHVLAQNSEGAVLDAYIRKFMRPAPGQETDRDLARGMRALGIADPDAVRMVGLDDLDGGADAPLARDPALDAARPEMPGVERVAPADAAGLRAGEPVASAEDYALRYAAGEWREGTPIEVEQFATNNGDAIETAFRQMQAEDALPQRPREEIDTAVRRYIDGKGKLDPQVAARKLGLTAVEVDAALRRHAGPFKGDSPLVYQAIYERRMRDARIVRDKDGRHAPRDARMTKAVVGHRLVRRKPGPGKGDRPLSLGEFIARQGGIRDDEGHKLGKGGRDLQRMTRNGPLIREDGLSADGALEAAIEAGYLHDPGFAGDGERTLTSDDLLQTLEADHGHADLADGVYAEADRGALEEWRGKRDQAEALHEGGKAAKEAASALGIKLTNAEARDVADMALQLDGDYGAALVEHLNREVALTAEEALDQVGDLEYQGFDYDQDGSPIFPGSPGENAFDAVEGDARSGSGTGDARTGDAVDGAAGRAGAGDEATLTGAAADAAIADDPGHVLPPADVTPQAESASIGATTHSVSHDLRQSPDRDLGGFTTAKGSRYVLHADGTTSRDKAFRPEHGAAEQGPQPRSDRTIFVTAEDALKLAEFQAQGGPKVAIAQTSDGRWGLKYLDGKDEGKFELRTVVSDQPVAAVGLTPVELWKDGTRAHFGNEITELKGPFDPAIAERQRQEAQLGAEAPLRGGNKTGKEQDGTMGLDLFDAADAPKLDLGDGRGARTHDEIRDALDADEAAAKAVRDCLL